MDFAFNALTPELQNLFQTNQLMAVIVNPARLGVPGPALAGDVATFERDVVIADWRMTAAVGDSLNSTSYNNILIMKYCDGTLLERVCNPNKWVEVDSFSVSAGSSTDTSVALTGLSSYLQSYLTAGIKAAADGNDLYDDFARIVQDPNWQGFIVLAADVDPSGFPDQIKGLIAGIDFTQFRAHHFGATASRVQVSGTSVTLQTPSSLFGLIDYELPVYKANVAAGGNPDMPVPLPDNGDFGFQVLQLQTLFRNAAMVDFRSHVQLSINQLFLSPVIAAYGAIGKLPATAVVLNGSYQRQGDTGVYVFEQNVSTRFQLGSNVLPAVAIQRVVFNTLSSGSDHGDDGIVRSRFLMSGALEFAVLSVLLPDKSKRETDLLSFGPPADAAPVAPAAGLCFSGLEVSMSSPADAPNAVTFIFEASRLALDQGQAKPARTACSPISPCRSMASSQGPKTSGPSTSVFYQSGSNPRSSQFPAPGLQSPTSSPWARRADWFRKRASLPACCWPGRQPHCRARSLRLSSQACSFRAPHRAPSCSRSRACSSCPSTVCCCGANTSRPPPRPLLCA